MLRARHALCLFKGCAAEESVAKHEGLAVITIVDYGAGNLRSVENTLAKTGAAYTITRDPEAVRAAEKVILPGVGHFGQMLCALDALGLRETLVEKARSGAPFLGICLGLQAMFESSEEAPEERGLALFPGRVQRFPLDARVPHMGWNEIVAAGEPRLMQGLGPKPYVYFAHSFYCPVTPQTAASCEYTGVRCTAVLEAGNIFGVQFHPEKSGPLGLKIVENFVRI
jgi:imidazole glycerol phosphate synthase glutamine amidotransferase subunit